MSPAEEEKQAVSKGNSVEKKKKVAKKAYFTKTHPGLFSSHKPEQQIHRQLF